MSRSVTTVSTNPTAPYGIFLLRAALGVMFIAHGLTKLLVFTLPGTAQFFASVGFPGWFAYPATFAEIIGGTFLLLGVMPRWVAGILAAQLAAASTVHFGNGWAFGNTGGGWEYPVFLTVAALAVALLGDGAFTLLKSTRPGR